MTATKDQYEKMTRMARAQYHVDQACSTIAEEIGELLNSGVSDGMTSNDARLEAVAIAKILTKMIPLIAHNGDKEVLREWAHDPSTDTCRSSTPTAVPSQPPTARAPTGTDGS